MVFMKCCWIGSFGLGGNASRQNASGLEGSWPGHFDHAPHTSEFLCIESLAGTSGGSGGSGCGRDWQRCAGVAGDLGGKGLGQRGQNGEEFSYNE